MGIPKSRSEPVDLKSKSLSKLRKEKSSTNQNKEPVKLRERSKSKSPRNSRVIPGVRIVELKFVSRSDQQKSGSSTPTKSAANEATTPTAVNINREVERKPVQVQVDPKFELDEPDCKQQADLEKPVEEDVTLMETLTESRVLELEANRVVETVVEHQKQQQQQQQNHYRLNLARKMIGSDDNSNSMTR